MSFLNEILKKKNNLKSNETRVTTSSGDVYKEYATSCGERAQIKIDHSSPGYVIDETPDKQIAQVLPWLCMGSQDVANDDDLLRANRITHVLSLGVMPVQYDQITYKFISIYDEPNYDIGQHFPECFSFIEKCRTKGNIVYVHCNAGISRSATIVIAYLMKHLATNLTCAYDHLKKVRPCIKPNDGFMNRLRRFEKDGWGGKNQETSS